MSTIPPLVLPEIHLAIPLFSRSSTSTTSTLTSPFLSPYDVDPYSQNGQHQPNHQDDDDDDDDHGQLSLSAPFVDRDFARGRSTQRTPSRSRSRSPSRPNLKKMPSWSSFVSLSLSRRSSDDSTMTLPSETSEAPESISRQSEEEQGAQLQLQLQLQLQGLRGGATETMGRSRSRQFLEVIEKGWHTLRPQKRGSRLSSSLSPASSGIGAFFRSDSADDEDTLQVSKAAQSPAKRELLPLSLPPRDTVVSMHLEAVPNEGYDYDRARRGSDWPPSAPRPLTIDLSGVSTFATELEASILSPATVTVAGSGMKAVHELAAEGDSPVHSGPVDGRTAQTYTYKKITVAAPSCGSSTTTRHKRVDTPLFLPPLPRPGRGLGRTTFLPPTVSESPALNLPELPEAPKVSASASSDDQVDTLPSGFMDQASPGQISKSKTGTEAGPDSMPLPFVPIPISTSLFGESPAQQIYATSPIEEMAFDLSIFSPRPTVPPAHPVLRAIIDTLPVSPLELPASQSRSQWQWSSIANFPTPVIPRNAPCSPEPGAGATKFGAFGSVEESVDQPATARRNSRAWTEISTALGAVPSSLPGSHRRSCSAIPIAAERGIPPSDSGLGLYRSNALSHRSTNGGSGTLPRTERRASRASISGLPTRRTSLIIRPSVLPCPTPPSLITSPKSLGTDFIPPLFSPSTISPATSRFSMGHGVGPAGLPLRRGRGSLRLGSSMRESMGGGSGLVSPVSLVGGVLAGEEQSEAIQHVPTPGTFGHEGEAERLVQAGINPYFA